MKKFLLLASLCSCVFLLTSGRELKEASFGELKLFHKGGIAVIGAWKFAYNKFEKVNIPDTVLIIEKGAFSNNAIKEIHFSSNLNTIGESAFANNNISSITLPHNLKYIGKNAFLGNDITEIYIGDSVIIEKDALPKDFSIFYNDMEMKGGRFILKGKEWQLYE